MIYYSNELFYKSFWGNSKFVYLPKLLHLKLVYKIHVPMKPGRTDVLTDGSTNKQILKVIIIPIQHPTSNPS